MAETIHFGEEFRKALSEYYSLKSVTEGAYNNALNAEFNGSDMVYVYEIATSPVNSYNKKQDPSTGSRFGTPTEVGDYRYAFKLTQDISFDRTIDRGNNDAQFFIKKVGAIMKAYIDKEIRPFKEKYRLKKWCTEAGIHTALAAAPGKSTIAEQIIDLHTAMIEEGVPDDSGTLFIPRAYLKVLKLSSEWVELDSLGGKSIPNGKIKMFDGLVVKPVPTRFFPDDCYFAIFAKDSIIAPEKINLMRGIKDSENMDGDRVQFRGKFDAFVMPSLCVGAAVACKKDSVTPTPSVSISSGKATVTDSSDGVVYYTLDGSDPRYASAEAKVYSAPVTVAAGDIFRCCAKAEGKYMSAATKDVIT